MINTLRLQLLEKFLNDSFDITDCLRKLFIYEDCVFEVPGVWKDGVAEYQYLSNGKTQHFDNF